MRPAQHAAQEAVSEPTTCLDSSRAALSMAAGTNTWTLGGTGPARWMCTMQR